MMKSPQFQHKKTPGIRHALSIVLALIFLASGSILIFHQTAAHAASRHALVPRNVLQSCSTTTSTRYTMAIQSPCSPDVVTANQVTAGALTGVAISDANASVVNGPLPVQVTAPGMGNVEVWTHSAMATRLTAGANNVFTGTLDLSAEPTGPLNVTINAWNTQPGDNSYTVKLVAQFDLFVHSTPANIPFPAGAAGMHLAWADDFNTLSATACKPGTGTWPNCTKPTAADGFTWYENKPGGGDFGDAAFEHTDSPYNPYTIDDGFLRIRSTYDPNYADPYGYNRHWYSGLLASAFPDGSSNAPNLQNGYYEARILTPNASAGSNTNASGGTWPAWWMINRQSLQPGAKGAVEIDTTEQYGNNPNYTQAGEISYGDATGGGWIYHADPGPDLTTDFHRYGMLINNGTATFYLDDSPLGSIALASEPGITTFNWFVMLNLAMGSGWPVNPPPANYYDMWIDYVHYYSPSAGGQLLSQNRPATASSLENSSYPASNAVDGNLATRWSSQFSDPQWLQVDLGTTHTISEVKLAWETAYASAYQIQVSNDAVNWTTIYSTTTGKGGNEDLTGLSGSGRYIRMYGTQRATGWGYSLWEFQVFGS